MKDWDGASFTGHIIQLTVFTQTLTDHFRAGTPLAMEVRTLRQIAGRMKAVRDMASEHEFDVLVHHAADILRHFTLIPMSSDLTETIIPAANVAQLQELFSALVKSAEPSLRGRIMFNLTTRGVALYEAKEPLFGRDVWDKFQDARDDIDEAGKCLAFRRNKACAFHLMLAMEHALREIAAKKNVTVFKGDPANGLFETWGNIARNLKSEYIDGLNEGSAEQAEWTSVHSMLWSVGKAWRNETMHPASSYNDEQAEKAFKSVGGFMQQLAPLV